MGDKLKEVAAVHQALHTDECPAKPGAGRCTCGAVGKVAMNYGDMPTYEAFREAFDREIGLHETYDISHGSSTEFPEARPAAGNYDCQQLFAECERLMKYEDDPLNFHQDPDEHQIDAIIALQKRWADRGDNPGSWVSSILDHLGFEWI